jgi:glycogen operon protein
MSWAGRDGAAQPQGAAWIPDERAFNFALYSKHAARVTLCLYGDDPRTPLLMRGLDHVRHKSGRIWHVRVPAAAAPGARYYAYRVAGPAGDGHPAHWHRFDAEKLFFDPYATAVYFPPAFDREAARHPGPNAGVAALGVLPPKHTVTAAGPRPTVRRHDSDAVVYELHVRGFTMDPAGGVATPHRGTFAGLAERIPYLQDLGVTVVELMPVFQNDPAAPTYWGYDPISFFALHAAYACCPDPERRAGEFREMVDAFHLAGIEVLLDVVYNHTGEGDQHGPSYSLRGIDNSTYYLMTDDPAAPYANLSGTGNTLHTANRYVRKLVVDSLRYWAEEMGVDGFRFDLASVFSRRDDGSFPSEDTGLFGDVVSDPVLSRLRLIAEPWDAVGTRQLGRSLPGVSWAQWNSRFQEDVRRFVRGDAGMVGALMLRLYGSDDLFPDDAMSAYRPWQSVNYVTCHDGFTLYDLVSYERKRNWENGRDNRDGVDENWSWNCGWEGDDGAPAEVRALRRRQARNLIALLLLANGTPMLRGGDELLQSQGGNNNAFASDGPATWTPWHRLDEEAAFHRFVRLMIAFRKAHPSLCRSTFWRGDVHWYGTDGPVDLGPDSRRLAYCLAGASEADADLYVMINAGPEPVPFVVQEGPPELWKRVVDTALASPDDIREPGEEVPIPSSRYVVGARSVVVLARL